jgi:hypothetical protein
VWSGFAKVIDLVTRKPTKLVWHFSDFFLIFYEFSKIITLRIKEFACTLDPGMK